MGAAYPPHPMLGSGEVADRYAVRGEAYPKLPWYFDNTKGMFAAVVAICVIVTIGLLFS